MKLYREDQKYHDLVVIGLTVVLSILLVMTLVTQSPALWKMILGLATVAALTFLVFRLRLKIRISPKKMSIRISPIPWTRVRFTRDEVTGIEFISSEDVKAADAWKVHYGSAVRIFNFGDREGMVVHRADGQDVVILSSRLFDKRREVLDQLELNGWNFS